MVLKHLLPERDFTWEQLDELTQSKPGMGTVAAAALMGATTFGLEAVLISSFDSRRMAKEGYEYLYENFGKEYVEWQKKHGDIDRDQRINRELLDSDVHYEHREATVDELRSLLGQGYDIFCGINANRLNGKKGYSGHSVLVYEIDGKVVKMHDPGLPPCPDRIVTIRQFAEAWQENSTGLRALRLPVNKPS